MIVILMGAPGAGKGTQADRLVAKRMWNKLSTGDALRHQISLASPVGKAAKGYMDEGKLVPDEVLLKILKEELKAYRPDEVVLLDGFPRNLAQAEALEELRAEHSVKLAIHLDVEREGLIERLSGRRTCLKCGASYHLAFEPPKREGVCDRCGAALVQRADDNAEKIAVRLSVFEKETRPILDFYKKAELYRRVEGSGSANEVLRRIETVVDELVLK